MILYANLYLLLFKKYEMLIQSYSRYDTEHIIFVTRGVASLNVRNRFKVIDLTCQIIVITLFYLKDKKPVSEHGSIHVGKTLIRWNRCLFIIHLTTGQGFFMPDCQMSRTFYGNNWSSVAIFGIF